VKPTIAAACWPLPRPKAFLAIFLASGLLGSLTLVTPVMAAPLGQNVWLRANANSQYVSADQNLANVQLVANRASASGWEVFTVVDAGGGLVELRASNGMYVSADSGLATYAPLVANRATASTWEKFQWIDAGSGQVQLKAQTNGLFVSADLNRAAYLVADRATASTWETFTWGAGSAPPTGAPTVAPTRTTGPTTGPTATTPTGGTMEIMTWLPSYSQSVWEAALSANTGGTYSPKNTLTRVAGQFWQVQSNGTLALGVSTADVQWVANYTKANGIKFLICVHDYVNSWDWGTAASAFGPNRTALVNSIASAVTQWGAAGADIDFEGNLAGDPNRSDYAAFIQALGSRLHSMGKELTVDIFPYIWNQPNMNWIGDWVGSVDGVNSMGYDSLYGGGSSWQSYRWQQDTVMAAGYKCNQFDMGMPGWVGTWGSGGLGTSVLSHVNELSSRAYTSHPTSVAIWDGQFNGSGWLSPQVWSALHAIRTTKCS
jgi:hypothetical protein